MEFELQRLLNDEAFVENMKTPLVREAILHWTSKKRLNHDEAEVKFMENYRVTSVFAAITNLQKLAEREGKPFPIQEILKLNPELLKEYNDLDKPARVKQDVDANVKENEMVENDDQQSTTNLIEEQEEEQEEPQQPETFAQKYLSMSEQNILKWWTMQLCLIVFAVAIWANDYNEKQRIIREEYLKRTG